MRLRELRADDLELIAPFDRAQAMAVEAGRYSFTFCREDGTVVACAGLTPYWDDRCEAWIFFGQVTGNESVAICKIAKRYLQMQPVRRVEAAVEIDNSSGHRLVKLLGFKKEAERLEAYLPSGSDCTLYARIG